MNDGSCGLIHATFLFGADICRVRYFFRGSFSNNWREEGARFKPPETRQYRLANLGSPLPPQAVVLLLLVFSNKLSRPSAGGNGV